MSNAPFKNGRMFVGWRRRDFKVVYYKPYEGDDPHDEKSGLTPSLYFTNAFGEETSPMMEGEVYFLPAFAYENCEAKTLGEKKRMQYNTLMDAFMLYNEVDPKVYAALMKSKEDSTWPRWNAVMKEIHKFKDGKMKTKEARRAKKAESLRRNGVPESELDKNMSSSDDDSGFDDDDDGGGDNVVHVHSRRSRSGPMNPPPRPTPRAPRKRSSGDDNNDDDDNDNDSSQPKTKKRKPATRRDPKDHQMSGGRANGDDTNGRARRDTSVASFTGIIDRDPSADFDANSPERSLSRRPRERDSESDTLFVSQESRESDVERRNRLGGYMQPAVEDEDVGAWNGNESEEDAMNRAIRASMEPANLPQVDVVQSTEVNGAETTRADVGRGTQADVRQSTEVDPAAAATGDDDEVTVVENGTAWRASSVSGRRSRSGSRFSNR